MKPKRWVERIETKCKDDFHDYLLNRMGVMRYWAEAAFLWNINDVYISPIDPVDYWIRYGTKRRFVVEYNQSRHVLDVMKGAQKND